MTEAAVQSIAQAATAIGLAKIADSGASTNEASASPQIGSSSVR